MKGSLQEKNGKYYAVFRFNGKQKWVNLNIQAKKGNKRKAEQALQDVLREYDNSESKTSNMLFVDFLYMWLEQIKPTIKPSTWEGYEKNINGKIVPYFKEKQYKLCDLKGMYFTDYFVYLQDKGRSDGKGGLSKKSVLNLRGVLSSAFEFALENDLVRYNFIARSRLPLFEEKEFVPTVYNAEQMKTLLKYAEHTQSKLTLFLYLEMFTGARKGELLALTWDKVDFDNGTIYISQNRTGSKKEVLSTLTTPKTKNGYRIIPLPQKVMSLLKKEKLLQNQNRQLLRSGYKTYQYDYVIRKTDGSIYSPNSINRMANALTRKAGLPHCRIHDYRHAVASLLFESGTSLQDVTTQLGHGQTSTTEKIYIHRSNIVKNENIQALSNLIGI